MIATEGSDVPKALNNIVVSIHAIATFQALHDYLRPRISGLLNSSRIFAALTGSLSSASSSRAQPPAEGSTKPPEMGTNESGPTRRRSLRLSAKKDAQNNTEAGKPSDDGAAVAEPEMSKVDAIPETGTSYDDTHIEADFTDDEVDADVCYFRLMRVVLIYLSPTGVRRRTGWRSLGGRENREPFCR